MPKIEEFSKYTRIYVQKAFEASSNAIDKGSSAGADYMREFIGAGSPTGTRWHKKKSPTGARMESGKMLSSVLSSKPKVTKSNITSSFGWLKNKEHYFVMQDSGGYWLTAYGKPSGVGMGFLNTAMDGEGRSTLRALGAYNKAANTFIAEMKNAGFTASAQSEDVF